MTTKCMTPGWSLPWEEKGGVIIGICCALDVHIKCHNSNNFAVYVKHVFIRKYMLKFLKVKQQSVSNHSQLVQKKSKTSIYHLSTCGESGKSPMVNDGCIRLKRLWESLCVTSKTIL